MKAPPRTLALLLILPLATVAIAPHRVGPWSWMQTVGVCLAVPAFILWFLSRVQLGDSFSVRAQARSLITTGLYAKIRNPIYVFGSLTIIGFILFSGRPILLVLFLVVIPLQLVRARTEARVLEQQFGDDYRRYRAATWF
jgi:protein-S-isoprenylcysteine O-methyltransferase Ste14